jgi:hypothetical protein
VGFVLNRTGVQISAWFLLAVSLLAQGLSPTTPAKEYIRLNGQVVAIENAVAAPSAPHGFIDFPAADTAVSGTITFAGWATSDSTTIDHVVLSIDGGSSLAVSYGGPRPDVCQVFPSSVGCPAGNFGWSLSYSTTQLSDGQHTVAVTYFDTHTP